MSYLPPNPAILPDGQEVKVHGSEAFPFAVYCGIIPTFIPAYPLHYHEEMELIYCETGSGSQAAAAFYYTSAPVQIQGK